MKTMILFLKKFRCQKRILKEDKYDKMILR